MVDMLVLFTHGPRDYRWSRQAGRSGSPAGQAEEQRGPDVEGR
jgi:hypothetical protein